MKRIVFVTQRIEPAHPVLGATVAKIAALAERLDEVTVLALSAQPRVLPANCRVRTFAAPTQTLRGLRFIAALAPELALRRPAAVLAHMSPIYAVLAAPLARPLGVRVLLWYTQWQTNSLLERAVRRADEVLTVDERSFPFASAKVRAIGHGIDISRFPCAEPPGRARLRLLALGRYSVVKDYPALIEVLRDVDAELVIHGSTETDAERAHESEVRRLAAELDGRVTAGGPVAPEEVPALLAASDALVSATRGGADKAVLEAGAACVPAFSPAPAFAALLPDALRFDSDLPAKLRAFAALAAGQRAALGHELRTRVEEQHSVGRWADRVIEAAGL
jgi:glycosyltransferase involved in cell wall biosynthesis